MFIFAETRSQDFWNAARRGEYMQDLQLQMLKFWWSETHN